MDAPDIFYLIMTIFFVSASLWMIGYMIYTSPARKERRHNKALAAIAQKGEARRKANTTK